MRLVKLVLLAKLAKLACDAEKREIGAYTQPEVGTTCNSASADDNPAQQTAHTREMTQKFK